MKFGVDTGGTFTDVVARDADGRLHVYKLLSTPTDPSEAIGAGVASLCDAPTGVVHGTTVATNALLERQGSRVAFVTTAGFEDLLLLRRQNRPELYALQPTLPEPLTRLTFGARERVLASGTVEVELTDSEVERIVDAVGASGAEAVAICLLHAYVNDAHEQRLATAIRSRQPETHVSVSSNLVREFREYERSCTTVVNAYVGPRMSRYIERLGTRLDPNTTEVLLSSGARASLDRAANEPVHTVLSGPAGGVVGAFAAAQEAGFDRILTFDMGGTSTDVSLCDGEPRVRYDCEIGTLPLKIPALDILTVGAGGGSVATVDAGGALRVGPQSAGAMPGPAAYGRGGVMPTVTDAHVVLGSLRPEAFLGGDMSLDREAAVRAVSKVAQDASMEVGAMARGILAVADAAMARAIKVICSRHGKDPRDFALVSFGGAGGLHACRLAEQLMIDTVIVPANPGVLSAYGMLHAPRARLVSRGAVAELTRPLLAELRASLSDELNEFANRTFTAALRYRGQAHELQIDADTDVDTLRARFHAEHRQLFGYDLEDAVIELVTLRASGHDDAPEFSAQRGGDSDLPPRKVVADLGGGDEPATVIDRGAVDSVDGPAIVTEYSGTTIVPRGWQATQRGRHLVVRRTL